MGLTQKYILNDLNLKLPIRPYKINSSEFLAEININISKMSRFLDKYVNIAAYMIVTLCNTRYLKFIY